MKNGKGSVNAIQFCPFQNGLLAAANSELTIWSLVITIFQAITSNNQDNNNPAEGGKIVFSHSGHQCPIGDFDWASACPWTLVTASDDSVSPHMGGGSLHIFRPIDLLTMPQGDAIEKLTKYKNNAMVL